MLTIDPLDAVDAFRDVPVSDRNVTERMGNEGPCLSTAPRELGQAASY
jgi:hypothetical protein